MKKQIALALLILAAAFSKAQTNLGPIQVTAVKGPFANGCANWTGGQIGSTGAGCPATNTSNLTVINVQASPYGATGNGTTDDTAAIQAAINACPQSSPTFGCIVFFPAGIYKTTSALTNGPSPYTYRGVHLWGDGTVGRTGAAATIQTNGAYYAFIAGNTTTANGYGLQVDNLGFIDNTGNGLGGVSVAGMTDGAITNVVCNNYYVGVCLTFDGGIGVSQYFYLTNIYTWHTRTRIQTAHRTASMFIQGGEGNCQNAGSTDVLANSYDLDIGYTRQVSWTGLITTSGTSFTINSFTTGLGSFTQDYVNAPLTIGVTTYTIATVTGANTGTFTTSAGTQSSVAGSIQGQGGTGEYAITTASQNCQTGRAMFNAGGMKFQGDKASEQTILYRPAGSFGVIVDGDNPSLTNANSFDAEQITASGTGIWIKPNAQNTAILHQTGDGTNGVDLVIDATAYTTTRIDTTYRMSGWTVNLATIARSANVVTATTVPNLANNAGNLCVVKGTLVTVYGVTVDTTFDGTFPVATVSCNDSTDVATLTWSQTGTSDSGSINATPCVGGSGGSCIAALSTITSTSTGLGVAEETGGSEVTDQNCQEMRVPPQQILPIAAIAGTIKTFCDGLYMDVIYGNPGGGVLHLAQGPVVPYSGNTSQYYQPQPTITNGPTTCTTPATTATQANVCQSSDDKGTVLASAPNGTTLCLPIPGAANGYPEGFTDTFIYSPGSLNNSWAIVLPGQASIYGGITCPGATGTTLNGTTAAVLLPPGQSLSVVVHGSNWYANTGVTTYTPPVPGNSVILTADSASITAVSAATATVVFTFPTTLSANTNYPFHCSGTTVQSTGGAGIGIAFGTSGTAATNMEAHAIVGTSPTTGGFQSSGNLSTTTESQIYLGTSGTATTQLPWMVDGTIEVGATPPTNFLIGFFTANVSDPVVVKRDSYCKLSL